MSEGPGLVAKPQSDTTATTGFGILESAEGLATGVSNGDWVAAGLGGVGVGLEVLSMVVDPVGTLASAGVSWLIEHVQPLKEALDWLAGDPPVIRSFSETWGNVAKEVSRIAQEFDNEAKNGTSGWVGAGADAYRAHSAELSDAIAGAGALAEGISTGVMIMGEVVAFVRETVREIVAELIGRLIAWALEAVCSLGLATPVIVGQAVAAISRVAKKIADLIRNLIKTIGNVTPRLRKIIDKLDEIMAKLGNLMRKGDGATTPSGATTPAGHGRQPTKPHGGDGATTSPSSANGPSTHPSAADTPSGKSPDDTSPSSSSSPNASGDVPPPSGKRNPDSTSPKSEKPRDADNGGQRSEGNGGCDGKGGDPVDTVSGQMITSKVDLALPGLLPLLVNRAYASEYRDGQLLGHCWSSTLDQRLELAADGILYFGDDAEVLSYPSPVDGPVLPLFGARWTLAFDAASDTYRIEDPESGWTRHFAAGTAESRPITALTDRAGHEITYIRDPAGLPLTIRHSGGYYVAVDIVEGEEGARLDSLRLIDQQGQGVRVASYQYDALGRLTGVVNSSALPYRYEYDAADRITRWTDRNGFSYNYEYRTDGRVTRGWNENGYLDATFDYDLENRVTAVTNSIGHITRHYYDSHNHITRVVDPLGNEERMEFDQHHRLLAITDSLGHTTRYTRDDNGDVVRVEHPDGTLTSVEYDERWRLPTRVTEPGGVTWQYTYSAAGALLTSTDPAGAVRTSDLDERGHLVATIAPDGARSRFTSDRTGRPTSATNPAGATTHYEIDGFGRLAATVEPTGAVTRYGYTIEGKLAWQIAPDGSRQELVHDAEGNILSSRGLGGGVVTFEVGPFNLPVARTSADGTRYTFDYDTELRLVRVTNPLGLTWDYAHDPNGRLVRESDFAGRVVTYTYDAAGRMVRRAVDGAPAMDVVRDARGRVVGHHVEGERPVRFEFSEAGHLSRVTDGVTEIAYERDALGRPLVESINGRAVRSEYDLIGRRIRRITPSGVETAWRFTPAHQAAAMVGTAGALTFEYDPAGREVTRRLGARAALTQSYDVAGRLASQQVWAHPSFDPAVPDVPVGQYVAAQQRTYRYRPDGVASAVDDRLRGDRTYELTPSGRVTAVNAASWRENYAYDALGNLASTRLGNSETAGPRVLDGVLLRSAGRSSYDYDSQGRLTRQVRRTLSGRRREWTYRWNGYHQLTDVTTPDGTRWGYVYDPFGRRVAKQRLDEHGTVLDETTFSWDGGDLAEQNHSSLGRVMTTSWDYHAATGEPLAQTSRSWLADAPAEIIGSRFDAIVSDLVGAPAELVGPDGRVSWHRTESLWGEELSVRGSDGADCPLRFPGQYHDRETGLHYNFHRYYDPATARYLSPDPLGFGPSANNYTYVVNPLIVSDPFGLASVRGARGRYESNPDTPSNPDAGRHQYPSDYRQSTHDEMAAKFTVEGQAARGVPVDSHGVRIPREQLNWVDIDGNPIPFKELTYDHNPPVVRHWIDEGYDQSRAERADWYNNTDEMEAMTREENSRRGALLTEEYQMQAPGPNHSNETCS
ncbi:RHS repeat-associated core domain-containing protein [Amycolatopsis sp. DG1A-15b]|uniref:RHS repeat-associated core domain-containing protein n=1 Tax=Amycolatopsis sp. DG1A-15b TaxID=3052846 RepID=UPI00255B8C5C|nr:RHS repeat-associated core domain-containing protein [Amycolatopsis sp. DG1A-15b]WIX85701.1 RHS repeat-associated core domain-containing protein [Amycolatopsis sp. DG1A-15b]